MRLSSATSQVEEASTSHVCSLSISLVDDCAVMFGLPVCVVMLFGSVPSWPLALRLPRWDPLGDNMPV